MFRIGEFARLSRVSAKMLRHYDELGLFRPSYVDPETDYRYYAAQQLPRIQRILALRDLGFGLDDISRMIEDDVSLDRLRTALQSRRDEIIGQVRREQRQLAIIESRIQQLEHDAAGLHYDIVVRSIAPQLVASIRHEIASGVSLGEMFDELEQYVASYHARAARPPLLVYEVSEALGRNLRVAVSVPLKAPPPGDERVEVHELAGIERAASVLHVGSYGELPRAWRALGAWLEANQYRVRCVG